MQAELREAETIANQDKLCTPAKRGKMPINAVKSPSDITIYAPAFVKSPTNRNEKEVIIDQISNFVDEMRIQHDASEAQGSQHQP